MLARSAVIAVVALAPALVAAVTMGPWVAVGVFLGLAIGVAVGMLCSLPSGVVMVAAGCLALVAGWLVQGSPLAAGAVAGIAGLLVGPANRRGVGRALALGPVLVAVAASGVFGDAVVPAAVGLLIGAAWGAMLTRALGLHREPVPIAAADAWLHAGALAVTCAVATYAALAVPLPHGYWIVVTLVSVIQPGASETSRATSERVVGTLLGSLLAVAAGALLPTWAVVIAVLGAMALFIAYAIVGDGVRRIAVMTVMLVLVLAAATGTLGLEVAVQRLAWTTVGAGLVVVAGVVVERLSHALSRSPAAPPPAR